MTTYEEWVKSVLSQTSDEYSWTRIGLWMFATPRMHRHGQVYHLCRKTHKEATKHGWGVETTLLTDKACHLCKEKIPDGARMMILLKEANI